jgi:outer membrane protein insertion porin family
VLVAVLGLQRASAQEVLGGPEPIPAAAEVQPEPIPTAETSPEQGGTEGIQLEPISAGETHPEQGALDAPLLPEQVIVTRIVITGNQRVDEEAIRVRIASPLDLLDEELVDENIRALYDMGFFRNITAILEQVDGQWQLTYRVQERPFIRDVRVTGAKKIEEEEIEGMVKLRPNTILDPQKARAGIDEVRKAYEQKGYLDADVRYDTTLVGENEVVVTFVIDEYEAVRIDKIILEGNREFSDRSLKGILATTEKGWFSFFTGSGNLDREVLDTDAERLTAFYYEHGYVDVRVDEPQIERLEDGMEVTFKIEEGEAYHFGEISVAGETLDGLETEDLVLESESGETFRPSKLREDMNAISERYGDRGYAFVNVTPDTSVNPSTHTVDVRYEVVRGPEVYIDRIEITGNTKTRDKVVRREMELQEQGRFSGSKLRRSQERIQRLGFFQDVNVTTRKAESEDRLDVLVDVREGNTGSFSAGAGISSGNSFLFNVSLTEINLFGRGQRLQLNLDLGTIRRNLSLGLTEPYFLDTQITVGLDVFNWQLEFDDFTRGGTGAGIRLLYPFEALGWEGLKIGPVEVPLVDTRLGLEYRIEEAKISGVSSTASTVIRAEQGTSLTSAIVPRIFRDTRNHPFDPTGGSMQDFSLEIAGLGGTTRFVKVESRARWFVPVWKQEALGELTFSTGWNFGYGLGYGGESELPLFERYFPGGINSVRGFEVRSLGPRVPVFDQSRENGDRCNLENDRCARVITSDVIGGSIQMVFNNELIFPLVKNLGLKGVVFFDAGNAFTAAQGLDFNEMRMSVGVGIRWLSPIGPLRIELGFPLNDQRGDETETIQFSFGGAP